MHLCSGTGESDKVGLSDCNALIGLVELPICHQLMVIVKGAACPPHKLQDVVLGALHFPQAHLPACATPLKGPLLTFTTPCVTRQGADVLAASHEDSARSTHLIHEAIEGLAGVSAAAIAILLASQHEGPSRLQRVCLARGGLFRALQPTHRMRHLFVQKCSVGKSHTKHVWQLERHTGELL